MMMKRNLEAEEIQGTINALVDTGRAMATSPKNLVIIRAIIIKKRKAIVTVVSERARKKSLTKTNGITKQNSTGVETNLQFVLAEKQSMQRLPMLQPPMVQ